jgi:hypothetical protein
MFIIQFLDDPKLLLLSPSIYVHFHGNMGTCKIGGVPQHNTLGFLCWGRSLKIHIEMKRELFLP